MQFISKVPLIVCYLISAAAADSSDLLQYLNDPSPQIGLKSRQTTAQRIVAHGYPAETHNVPTEDGYILTLFRIPYSHKLQNQNSPRPIVLLQHGLFSCSDIWVIIGPNDALPFLLADAGFDVWIGNARGNTYSRKHMTRSLNHPYFWRFSWHEIGFYDLPAMMDYILSNTNGQRQTALHYVGHSQGTTAFLAFLSTRPDYNDKIKTAHMLAPVAYMSNMSDKLVRTLAPYLGHHNTYSAFFDSQEFIPYNELFMLLAYNTCGSEARFLQLCSAIAYMLEGEESRTNLTALPYLAETHPAGASTNQICHYMQEQQSGYYRRFDYGTRKNVAVYDQEVPPDYPVEQITALLHLWYGDNDSMAAVEDVLKLAERLPNKVVHHMENPLWAHGEFVMAWDVRQFVNDPVVQIMLQYEEKFSESSHLNKE